MNENHKGGYEQGQKYYLVLSHSLSYPLRKGEGKTSPVFREFDIYSFFPVNEDGYFQGWSGMDYRRVVDINENLSLRVRPLSANSRDHGRAKKWLLLGKRGIVNDDAKCRASGNYDKRPRVNGETAIKTEEELILMLLQYEAAQTVSPKLNNF